MKRMKGLFYLVVIIGIGIVSSFVANNYTRECVVSEVDSNVVTFTDTNGNDWEWEIEEGQSFRVNENVKLRMNINNTVDNVTDDVIVRVIK